MSGKGNPKEGGAAEGLTSKCRFVECSKKPQKFGFCSEHYDLYMAGVIRGDGLKPSDYEEKLARHKKGRDQKTA